LGSCIIAPLAPIGGNCGNCGRAVSSPEDRSSIMYGRIVVPNALGVVPNALGVVPNAPGVVPNALGVVPNGLRVVPKAPNGLGVVGMPKPGIIPNGAGAGPMPNGRVVPNGDGVVYIGRVVYGMAVVVTPGGRVGIKGPNGLSGASPGVRLGKGSAK